MNKTIIFVTLKKLIRSLFLFIFLPLLIFSLMWASYLYLYGNFHQIDDEVYRSAQLRYYNMSYYMQKHKIKTILNLRGEDEEREEWYVYEKEYSKKNNIKHINYGIGSGTFQSIDTMKDIIKVIESSQKPLLIHCRAGADRTSLVSALYVYNKNKNKEEASKQISFLYGHFPWFGSDTIAMDKSFDSYISTVK